MSFLQTPVDTSVNAWENLNLDSSKKWDEKLDRQLRLWGIHGQTRISEANVCLLKASSVGCEVLKNIILPGFGKFTIIDGKKITPKELGRNFFFNKEGLGQNRAKIAKELLEELNSTYVTGNYLEETPENLIENQIDFLERYNYIIASNLSFKYLLKLAKFCWEKNIVFIAVRSYGMIGYIRVQVPSHEVVEAKLDNPIDDLRLTHPWKELLDFVDSQDLSTMKFDEHKHTPYAIILLKLLKRWRAENNDKLPTTKQEKEQFKEFIKNSAIKFQEEENFIQAYSKAHYAWTEPEIPEEVREILNDERAKEENLTKDTSDFWFLAYGVKKFVENEGNGQLPLQGTIPDMESDSKRYIALQDLYKLKSRKDMNIVKKYVQEQLKRVGKNDIPDMDIKEFCKNAHYLRVFNYRSMEEEFGKNAKRELIEEELQNPESNMIYYLLLRAVDIFADKEGYYPGSKLEQPMDDDIKKLNSHLENLLNELKVNMPPDIEVERYVTEVVRAGASELHNISSLVGGVGAQELIKLCTRQRIPLVNTWVFDGIRSVSSKWDL